MKWNEVATDAAITKTAAALMQNGIEASVVDSGEQAKAKLLELVPHGAEVMNMTSMTLEALGIPQVINESGNYNSVRNKLNRMDRATQSLEIQKLGAAPEWTLGSVNAVTEDGKVVMASNTGSQLGAYAYASPRIIWVVGAQKIVKDVEAGIRRINEYVLPLEEARMQKARGVGSYVSKLLIINKEVKPGRITIIIVKEALGF